MKLNWMTTIFGIFISANQIGYSAEYQTAFDQQVDDGPGACLPSSSASFSDTEDLPALPSPYKELENPFDPKEFTKPAVPDCSIWNVEWDDDQGSRRMVYDKFCAGTPQATCKLVVASKSTKFTNPCSDIDLSIYAPEFVTSSFYYFRRSFKNDFINPHGGTLNCRPQIQKERLTKYTQDNGKNVCRNCGETCNVAFQSSSISEEKTYCTSGPRKNQISSIFKDEYVTERPDSNVCPYANGYLFTGDHDYNVIQDSEYSCL